MRVARAGLVVVAVVSAGAVGAGLAWRDLEGFRTTPFGTDEEKVVEVRRGASLRASIQALARAGVLSSERSAWRYARYVRRDRRTPKAGEYAFRGALTPDEVLDRLYAGAVRSFRFTIREGLRMDEIAEVIERSGAARAEALLALMRDERVAWKLGIPSSSLEGFLFPDTYVFAGRVEPVAIVRAMVRRYQEEWSRIERDRAATLQLGEVETVTLASIVEKETGDEAERRRIACVFHNRLRQRMRLDADPTVLYAKMLRTGKWSNNITRADLRSGHAYNTYTRVGLPPGPIASPGAAALRAAANPEACEDLFFVARSDGSHAFCRDLSCHEAEVRRWQAR